MSSIFEKKRNVVFIALFYTFLWGSAFPLVKLCMESFGVTDDMSKCLVAGIRFFISGLSLTAVCLAKDGKGALVSRSQLLSVLLYGVLGTAFQYAFTYMGLSRVDAAKGAIFDQLCVFIIIIVSAVALKNDKLTLLKLIGCVLGFAGVIAVSTEKMSLSFTLAGEGMMTLAALCQTVAYFVAVFAQKKITAMKLVGYGQLVGGFLLIVFSALIGGTIPSVSFAGVLVLLALAAISAVAYVLSLIPLKYFPASEISVFNLLITVFGMIMSALVLSESIFKINYLLSLVLISSGIVAVNFKGKKNGKNI